MILLPLINMLSVAQVAPTEYSCLAILESNSAPGKKIFVDGHKDNIKIEYYAQSWDIECDTKTYHYVGNAVVSHPQVLLDADKNSIEISSHNLLLKFENGKGTITYIDEDFYITSNDLTCEIK